MKALSTLALTAALALAIPAFAQSEPAATPVKDARGDLRDARKGKIEEFKANRAERKEQFQTKRAERKENFQAKRQELKEKRQTHIDNKQAHIEQKKENIAKREEHLNELEQKLNSAPAAGAPATAQ